MNDFMMEAAQAIAARDYGQLEMLRGSNVRDNLDDLIALYARTEDAKQRDALVFLVQDSRDARLRPLMEAELHSANAETRALALCYLQDDFELFDQLLTKGSVDAVKVDKAIAAYERAKPS